MIALVWSLFTNALLSSSQTMAAQSGTTKSTRAECGLTSFIPRALRSFLFSALSVNTNMFLFPFFICVLYHSGVFFTSVCVCAGFDSGSVSFRLRQDAGVSEQVQARSVYTHTHTHTHCHVLSVLNAPWLYPAHNMIIELHNGSDSAAFTVLAVAYFQRRKATLTLCL